MAVALSLLLVAASTSCSRSARDPAPTKGANAHRMIFWANCRELAKLSDAQLAEWKGRGFGGFVCVHHHLRGMGGSQRFTASPSVALTGPAFELQRTLRDSKIAERARSIGLKMYLGFYLVNAQNRSTPLLDWFNDAGWRQTVLPAIRDISGAAKALGFDGLSMDQELYTHGNSVQTWPWNYPGNTRPEADVRAKVRQRGAEVMQAILEGFPEVDLMTYSYTFDGDWSSLVQEQYNNIQGYARSSTFVNWYDGLSSFEGYRAIRLFNTAFYKMHSPASSWDNALAHEYSAVYSVLSQRLSNWDYASSRMQLTPGIWIDNGGGGSAYEAARPPEYVASQLEAMTRWGSGGEVVVFSSQGLAEPGGAGKGFDYRPYQDALADAGAPRAVDGEKPAITLHAPGGRGPLRVTGTEVALAGTARDDMAVRKVTWETDGGEAGAARMRWRVRCGDYQDGYDAEMAWEVPRVPLKEGTTEIRVTAEDVSGLTATRTIEVEGGSSTPSEDETAPDLHVSSPECNGVVTDRVVVSAEATDNVAVTKVEFALDGTVKKTATAPPYTWDWDTLSTGEGPRTIGVKAYDSAGKVASRDVPVVVQTPPSQFVARKVAKAPVVDGSSGEYGASSKAVFGRPRTTNSVTARALWDAENLYLAFDVQDKDLYASVTQSDGNVWEDDAVEWFVDARADGGGSSQPSTAHMRSDDHQGIVSASNVRFDARGTVEGRPDASWNGSWTSAVSTQGSLNSDSGGDRGYTVEVAIPWRVLGFEAPPADGAAIGLGFAVDDRDPSGKTAVMWPAVATGFQNASNWHLVRLVS